MPKKLSLEEIAKKFKQYNFHGLAIVGGFEVSFQDHVENVRHILVLKCNLPKKSKKWQRVFGVLAFAI